MVLRKKIGEATMLNWTDKQLEEAGLDKKQVLSIVRRLRKLSTEMNSLGLSVYGCSGSGCLVHHSHPTHDMNNGDADPGCVIAELGQCFDGGDF